MTASSDSIIKLISEKRFQPYLHEADNDMEKALELYVWSAEMSAAVFVLISHVEVLLRNAIDKTFAEYFCESRKGIPWFLSESFKFDHLANEVAKVRTKLPWGSRDSRDQIVANSTFGFWSAFLGKKYEDEWRDFLRLAFPGSNGTRKQVQIEVEAVRKLRNKIAHHDSILNVDVPFEVRRLHGIAAFLGVEVGDFLRSVDNTAEVYKRRPVVKDDTLILAGESWCQYQRYSAVICAAGRAFRPLKYMAFYYDQGVQKDVPEILHRRDDVIWSRAEAQKLKGSSLREDRKIGQLIDDQLDDGESDGRYQVFLLTRPGDSRHRTLSNIIKNVRSGKGSAFVTKHRYTSLHSLENAVTTSDLT